MCVCAGFVPMIWGYWGQQFPALPGYDTVLGFNEPNHSGQADLDPETAAWAWLELQVGRHGAIVSNMTLVCPGRLPGQGPGQPQRLAAQCRGLV